MMRARTNPESATAAICDQEFNQLAECLDQHGEDAVDKLIACKFAAILMFFRASGNSAEFAAEMLQTHIDCTLEMSREAEVMARK